MAEMIKVRLIDGPTTCIGFSSNMSASRVLRHLGNLGRGVLRRSDGTDVEASAEPLPLGSYTYTFSPAVAPGGPFHQHDHPSQVLICGPVGEPITRIPLAVIKKYPDIQFEDEGDGYGLKHRTFASYKGIMPIVAAYLTSPSPLVAKIQLKGLSLEDAKTLELYARIYDITPLHEDVQDMLGQRTRRRRTQTAQEQQRLQPTRTSRWWTAILHCCWPWRRSRDTDSDKQAPLLLK